MTSPRFRRRQALGAAGAISAGMLLPGCGNRPPDPDGPLQVWGGVPAESGPGDVLQGFQEAHPGSEVVYTRYVNDERGNLKLDSALQGGVDIDVYFTYTNASLSLRSESGLTLDLTERVRSNPDLAAFLDRDEPRAYWRDDQIHGLATVREPNFVLVNESRRQAAGVDLPQEWTMQDYRDFAAALTTDSAPGAYSVPDLARIALGPDYWYADDHQSSNFDNPYFLQGLRLGEQMIKQGSSFPWTDVLARQLEAYQQNAFLQEQFAVWPTAPWNLRYLSDDEEYPHDFRVGCAPVPTVEGGGNWDTGTYGNFVMINPKSARKDLAWEFVTYWATHGGAPMMQGGKIPALDVLSEDEIFTGLLGEEPERYFDAESFRRVLFDRSPKLVVDTVLTAYPEIELAYQQQRDLCWIGEKSAASAIAEVDAQADAAVARNRGADQS